MPNGSWVCIPTQERGNEENVLDGSESEAEVIMQLQKIMFTTTKFHELIREQRPDSTNIDTLEMVAQELELNFGINL